MIRTPEAKRQAEILMSEVARHGLTLQRGNALDIVAKMQGLKGWNELSAADAKAPLDIAPALPAAYEVAGLEQLAAMEVVDCRRLAAFLKHGSRDATTTLLNFTAPDGGVYRLQLCGQVRFDYLAGNGAVNTVRSSDGLAAYDAAEHAAEGECTVLDTPFFEWVDAAGDPIGAVFEELPISPEREISVLKLQLK